MANVTRQTLVGQGHDPRDFALLAFGGGGGLFASEVARTLDIPSVIIPRHPSVFSAWGMLSADIVGSFARSYLRQIPQVEIDYVKRLFAEMESEALELTERSRRCPRKRHLSSFDRLPLYRPGSRGRSPAGRAANRRSIARSPSRALRRGA